MALESLLQPVSGSPFVLLPAALLLGALHGLEPGHAKTLMAAFIVAVRGTARQAVLLGLAAAASHTLAVWVLVAVGLGWGKTAFAPDHRSLLLLATGLLVLFFGVYSASRAWRTLAAPVTAEDAHARAHADAFRRRFADRRPENGTVGDGQVLLFGLAGGLVPCSAAVSVLLISLQNGQAWVGISLVAAFTLGLATMLIGVGLLAASGSRIAAGQHRWSVVFRWAPCASGVVLAIIGLGLIDGALSRLGL
jgi:nickel/cobalt exporter